MVRRARDGSTWRIGTDGEVAWIADGISTGLAITAAIPGALMQWESVLSVVSLVIVE